MGLPMMLRAGPLTLLIVLFLHEAALAQIVVGPMPANPGYGGLPFGYYRGGLTISGYSPGGYLVVGPGYPAPPFAVATPKSRIIINKNYNGNAPVLGPGYQDDTRGYDLDALPPKKANPAKDAEPEPAPEFKGMPGVDVSVPKKPLRPEDVPPMPKEPDPKPRPEPRDGFDKNARPVDFGLWAFARGEYGLAAQWFRQATVAEPKAARGYFLLAQAEFALGKYRDAVLAIHAGMKLDKQWPLFPVHPRVDIYKDAAADFPVHIKLLEQALLDQPNNPTLLFQLAHQLWFDGQRADALVLFRRARPLTKDTTFIDAFLLAGGPGVVAAN
jgi:hypothetical protein